jgi:ATP-dependent helicase YprA (DUF1998 family)
MSLLPESLVLDVINHLESPSQDALGRLYSSLTPRPPELDRFMPSTVRYRYWLPPSENGESSTIIEFTTGHQRKEMSHRLQTKLADLLRQDIIDEVSYKEQALEHNKSIIVSGLIRISKAAKPASAEPNAPIQVQVTVENRASYTLAQANTSLAEDEFPERTTSIYNLRLHEELSNAQFIPDPRIKSRERFFVTENIVSYNFKERTKVEFRDYGQANETVERPSKVTRTVSESIRECFRTESDPSLVDFSEPMARALEARGITKLSEFQERSLTEIAKTLRDFVRGISPHQAFLLNAPTAGGKTEAFAIPILAYVWTEKTRKPAGTKTLIFYPTKALADDQFQRLSFYVASLNRDRTENPITLGIFHGDVKPPKSTCQSPTCKGRLGVKKSGDKLEIYCMQCNRLYLPNQVAPPKGKCPWCYEGFCPHCNTKLTRLYECDEHGVMELTPHGNCQLCGSTLVVSRNLMKCPIHGQIDFSDLALSSEIVAKRENPASMHDVDFLLKHSKCGRVYPYIAFLRNQVLDRLPDIVITNPDIMHSYITRVPGRNHKFADWNFYEYQKVYRLLGMSCYYCESCKWTFDSPSGECPLPKCERKGKKALTISSRLGFLVVDEIHMIRGNFGCNATGFFSNLIETIKSYSNIRPICVSATATVKNERQPPASIFGFDPSSIVVLSPNASTTEAIHERLHLFILPKGLNTISALREVLAALYVKQNSLDSFPRIPRADRRSLQTLVFFDNKRNLYETATTLQSATIGGAEIEHHTADVLRGQRRKIEEDFSSGKIQVLLATSTLEVGVDFDFLKLLINFGVPFSYNSYLQRVGRAGRRGPALIINILRYQVPLDNYYFENFNELITYSRDNVDIVPIVRDIPLSVRRHVFAMAASRGIFSHTVYSARAFYQVHLENDSDFQKFLRDVEATFMKPPMVREEEVKKQLRNASEYLREELANASQDRKLNDALDDIARKDPTHRLDFSLRNNEIEVPVFIQTPNRFRASLKGSRSTPEDDVDIDAQEPEAPSED